MGMMSAVRAQHEARVFALQRSYNAIPAGEQVRLAKSTTNLFRPRNAATRPGLDVRDLTHVLDVDPVGLTCEVEGMTTYEDLVDATLAVGCMPLVVPQLKTITIGGAVTGLGIESTSFRNGLPHESVLELDILTGAGEVVTATPDGEAADLFAAFANSYGSLGYATRLKIQLQRVHRYVHLRHIRYTSLEAIQAAIVQVCADQFYDGESVDFVDGVVFSADESYLVLGSWTDSAPYTSDYTGQQIYYRSIQERREDYLTVRDYLWRWDTDWFWCSRAMLVQNPTFRRFVPKKYLRSDVYGKIVRFEDRHGWYTALERRRGEPEKERVVQDVEVPVERTAEFMRWFLENVPIEPIWLCPIRLRDSGPGARTWPLYPMDPEQLYVNIGFWSKAPIEPGRQDGDVNRDIERVVTELGGHKSLYSDAYYQEDAFWELYGGEQYDVVKKRWDPDGRLPDLYEKAVGRQ